MVQFALFLPVASGDRSHREPAALPGTAWQCGQQRPSWRSNAVADAGRRYC